MKIEFRQTSPGWCTVYTLANIFRSRDFLRYTDHDRFKGCGKEEVDFMLAELGTGLKVEQILYASQNYPALPKGYIYNILKVFEEPMPADVAQPVIPFLLTVRLVPVMHHSVAALRIRNELYYIDPYKEEWVEIESFEQFNTLFIDCCQVERLCLLDNRYAILRGEELGYPTHMGFMDEVHGRSPTRMSETLAATI